MVGALKFKVSEDELEKLNKAKATRNGTGTAAAAAESQKRSALGDLQNKGLTRAAPAPKDLKETKLPSSIATVRARVDTNLRRSATTTTAAAAGLQNVAPAQSKATAATVAPAAAIGKVITRSNSVRHGTALTSVQQSNAVPNLLYRHGSTRLAAAAKPTKTVTTKLVESNKLQQVKIINKVKPATAAAKVAAVVQPTLRREDSNLARAAAASKVKALAAAKQITAKASTKEQPLPSKLAVASKTSKLSDNNAAIATTSCLAIVPNIKAEPTHSSKMLENVEDIDAEDKENLMLVAEYVNDIYAYLYSLEDVFPIRPDHLANQDEIYPKMRAVLVDWIVDVHVQFHLAPETFQLGVAIIDRYLQLVQNTKRTHLQLVGVTALFIAAKYEELFPPAIGDFVYITDNTYSMQQILHMEMKIFKTLDYNLSRPLPIHFLRRFSKAAKVEDIHHSMSKYFLELSLNDYELASCKPSKLAAAALFLSLHLLQPIPYKKGFNDSLWTRTLEYYTHYDANELRPVSQHIASIARQAPNEKLKAVYSKYNSSKFQRIALNSQLYGELIDSIISKKEQIVDNKK